MRINRNHNFLLATPRCKRLQTLQQWRSVFDVASVAAANRYRSGNLRLIAIAIGPRKIWSTTNRVCVGVNWRKRRFAAEWPRKGAGPAPQLLMAIGRYGSAEIRYLSSIVRDENHVTKQTFQLADERANWRDRCCIGRRMMEILFSFIAAAVFCHRKNLKNH